MIIMGTPAGVKALIGGRSVRRNCGEFAFICTILKVIGALVS